MRTVPSSPGLCAGFELLCLEKEERTLMKELGYFLERFLWILGKARIPGGHR